MTLQLLINAAIAGSVYSLIGIGFALIYNQAKFIHFSHGAVFTAAPYIAFVFMNYCGLPSGISIVLGIFFSIFFGIFLERGLYLPLRRNNASPMIMLVASLGIYVVFENTISMCFGDQTKSIRSGVVREGLSIFGARITPIQILTIFTSLVLMIALALFLKRTKLGTAMRAVANDPNLAKISGIRSDYVILCTFAIGSVLAGVAGILVALDTDMTPTMGMTALMMGIAAVIVGGMGSIPGVAFGALLLGIAQQLGVWKVGSQWQDAIAFVILLVFLLFKPEGFLGTKVKQANV